MLNVQVHEMKSMSTAIQKLEGRSCHLLNCLRCVLSFVSEILLMLFSFHVLFVFVNFLAYLLCASCCIFFIVVTCWQPLFEWIQ